MDKDAIINSIINGVIGKVINIIPNMTPHAEIKIRSLINTEKINELVNEFRYMLSVLTSKKTIRDFYDIIDIEFPPNDRSFEQKDGEIINVGFLDDTRHSREQRSKEIRGLIDTMEDAPFGSAIKEDISSELSSKESYKMKIKIDKNKKLMGDIITKIISEYKSGADDSATQAQLENAKNKAMENEFDDAGDEDDNEGVKNDYSTMLQNFRGEVMKNYLGAREGKGGKVKSKKKKNKKKVRVKTFKKRNRKNRVK